MNLHGYKLKSKGITRLIKIGESKNNDMAPAKLQRLKRAKKNINEIIRKLQKEKRKKK